MKKATREQTRDHNARLVLKTLYEAGELSRADLARATGLTRPTVSNIVSSLLNEGLVAETGLGPSVGGKPPTILGVRDDARHKICLDLSGVEFRGAVIDMRGDIRHREAVAVAGAQGDAALALVTDLVDRLLQTATAPVLGIGVGTPGLVNPQQGIVLRAVNLGWSNLALAQILEEHSGLAVYVANDSHAAALAEYTFGPVHDSNHLIAIRIGQGVGAGIVLNGHPFYGDGFGAGEIGHVVVDADGALCTCGNSGCLEMTSSIRAMLRQAAALGNHVDTWDGFANLVNSGDRPALDVVTSAGHFLGVAIANLVGSFNIHQIVLAGRVAALGDPFLKALREEMEQRVLPAMAEATHITYSTLGPDIVLLGASALVLQRELGII